MPEPLRIQGGDGADGYAVRPERIGTSMTARTKWWTATVVYQIYPRSFADASGDGVGDLVGITERLDYVADLGVGTIWLSPFYRSPMHDYGYDITDHTDVDPSFGTLADFDALIVKAHALDLKVLVDFVPNHTSSDHPWFVESRSSRDSEKREWYVWADPRRGDELPNNWLSVWGGSAWELDERTGQYYQHLFSPNMPDLNWHHPPVREAMFEVVRFWLDRGVDGFRIDVPQGVMKDPRLRDNPPATLKDHFLVRRPGPWNGQLHVYDVNYPDTHSAWREFRTILDAAAPPERMSIAEVHAFEPAEWASWFGADLDEFHLPFNFSLIHTAWDQHDLASTIQQFDAVVPEGAWPNWVLGNHDVPRVAARLGPECARVAMMLLLTLRGTPTLYYGDELGLPDAAVHASASRDPAGGQFPELSRDPCRAPMPWRPGPGGGFTSGAVEPWLPMTYAPELTVECQCADPDSMLNLTRDLLAARRASPALSHGSWSELPSCPDVLAYRRHTEGDERLVLLNLGAEPREVSVRGPWQVELSTDRARSGRLMDGSVPLTGCEGVILRRTTSDKAAR